jgi:hypothetical protein
MWLSVRPSFRYTERALTRALAGARARAPAATGAAMHDHSGNPFFQNL